MKNIKSYRTALSGILFLVFSILAMPKALAQPLLERLNSQQKIERALKKGEIKNAEAIGYQVLAFFNDPALPPQFADDPEARPADYSDLLLNRAMEVLTEMPETLASVVYAHMIPPPYRASGLNKAANDIPKPEEIPSAAWAFIDDLTMEIRVWYEKDNADQLAMALKIKKAMADEIIPSLKTLMGRTHPRDDLNNRNILVQVGISRGQPNGGDGKLDIYIFNINAGTKAWAQGYGVEPVSGVGCAAKPSYMAVNLSWAKTAPDKKFVSTMAHEYFHTIQMSYNRKASCPDYDKMDEGTATYIKHHVYPKYNDEHDWFFWSEDGRWSFLDVNYATWPFYYFLAEMQGAASMAQLYQTMESKPAVESLNAVLSGGFKKQWLEYAVYEWNQEPLMDGFKQWDNYTAKPGRGELDANQHMPPIEIEKVVLDANGQFRKDMEMELKPLTRDFYAFDVSSAGIRSIAIENPVFWNGSKVKVKALVRKRGESQFDEILWEDVNLHEYHYCLDKKDEDIDLVVLVIGNFQYLRSGTKYRMTPAFKVTNQGCFGFKGHITNRWNVRERGMTHDLTVQATDVIFKHGSHSDDGIFKNQFYLESAKVTYNYTGNLEGCKGSGSGSFTPKTGKNETTMALAAYNVAPEAWGQYGLGIRFEEPSFDVTYVCPPPKKSFTSKVIGISSNTLSAKIPHHGGNTKLEGSGSGQGGWTVDWSFDPIRE